MHSHYSIYFLDIIVTIANAIVVVVAVKVHLYFSNVVNEHAIENAQKLGRRKKKKESILSTIIAKHLIQTIYTNDKNPNI